MKGKKRYIFTFLLVLIISLIAHIPAIWIEKFENNQFNMEGITGTLWKGSAQQLRVQNYELGAVYWRFQPWKIFTGKLEYQTRLGQGSAMKLDAKARLGVGFSGPYAQHVLVSLPAMELLQYVPMANNFPINLQGRAELSLSEWVYDAPWCRQATGSVTWSGAELITPIGRLAPGSIIGDLSCDQNNIRLIGQHEEASVSGAFDVQLSKDTGYQVSAWFKPEAQFPDSLSEQLHWLGTPNNQGQYSFNLSGRL